MNRNKLDSLLTIYLRVWRPLITDSREHIHVVAAASSDSDCNLFGQTCRELVWCSLSLVRRLSDKSWIQFWIYFFDTFFSLVRFQNYRFLLFNNAMPGRKIRQVLCQGWFHVNITSCYPWKFFLNIFLHHLILCTVEILIMIVSNYS